MSLLRLSPPTLLFGAALFVVAGADTSVSAQGVQGRATDERTSAPLAGVLIVVLDSDEATAGTVLTDADGGFTVPLARPGTYRVRGERIGLRTVLSDPFVVEPSGLTRQDVRMADRAVEIEGLVVDSRVRSCRPDPVQAPRIQRWWGEIRTALGVSAFMQDNQAARFRVQQFERQWSADLRTVMNEQVQLRIGFATRPFVSLPAERLVEDGFVQGAPGSREYYAPDAEVLLADDFLAEHCFSLVEDDEEDDRVGIRFEPTRDNKTAEILGTLWVDTVTAALDRLEYRYANLDWLPPNEAGGEVVFRYLPSGAWIVSDWFIRMPQVGVRRESRGSSSADASVVVGYVDVGGRVRQLSTTTGRLDGRTGSGTIRGEVHDSLDAGPLVGARVVLLGTRFSATTDIEGRYRLDDVPAGDHVLSFFHEKLADTGLGSSVVEVSLEDEETREVDLATPRFRTAARALCGPVGAEAVAVLTGVVTDAAGDPVGGATVVAYWESASTVGTTATGDFTVTTGSDGRYRVCTAPAETRIDVTVELDARPAGSIDVVLPSGAFTSREIRIRR